MSRISPTLLATSLVLFAACTGGALSGSGDPNKRGEVDNSVFVDSGPSQPAARDASMTWPDAAKPKTSGETCETLREEATKNAPHVMIALDQSGSMAEEGRWSSVVQSINGLVSRLQDEVAFGLTVFGIGGSCGSVHLVTGAKLGNQSEIAGYLSQAEPSGRTPTAEALRRVAAQKRNAIANTDGSSEATEAAGYHGVSSLILITDGAPNCNHTLDQTSCVCTHSDPEICERARTADGGQVVCLDDDGSVAAIEDLRSLGVETYVIGYSTSAWADVLNRMAQSGSARSYVPVENAFQLESSLKEVTAGLQSCSFELEEEPADITFVRVLMNGNDVQHSSQVSTGGWALEGKTVLLLGSDCDRARSDASASLEISVECEQVFYLR